MFIIMSELFIISSQQQKGFFNTFSKNIYLIVASPTLHWHYNFFPELRIKPLCSLRVTLILLWTIFTLFSNKKFEITIVIWHYMNQTEFNFHLLFCSIWEDLN